MNVLYAIHLAIISMEQPVQVWTQFVPHVEGTIENCWWYENNADECIACQIGYHFDETNTCASSIDK